MGRLLSGKKLADIGLVYCAAAWGSTFIITKNALAAVDPVAMVAIRFLISALLLLPWALRRKNFSVHLKDGFVLALFLSVLYNAQTIGLQYISASNSGFISGLFIIFIPVFMFLLRGEKPCRQQLLSGGLAVLGMWLLTGGISGVNRGDLLTLAAAASYSAHMVFTDKYIKAGADTLMLAFHQFWMIALISFALGALLGSPLRVEGLQGWGVILFLAVFPTITAFFIQMFAQKQAEPFKVGLIFTLEPVFAAFFTWTWGGETLVPMKAVGGFLIVSGMLIGEIAKLYEKNTERQKNGD